MKDINLELMRRIVNGLTASDGWTTIERTDPGIVAETEKLNAVQDRLSSFVSSDLLDELNDAICASVYSWITAAMLYGMHAAFTIQATASDPAELSRYLNERKPK